VFLSHRIRMTAVVQSSASTPSVLAQRPRLFASHSRQVPVQEPTPIPVETTEATETEKPKQEVIVVKQEVSNQQVLKDAFDTNMTKKLVELIQTFVDSDDSDAQALITTAVGNVVSECSTEFLRNQSVATTSTSGRKTCAGTRADGQPCNSTFVIRGTLYCTHHDPSKVSTTPKKAPKSTSPKVAKQPCQGTTKKGAPCASLPDFCKSYIDENGQTLWFCKSHIPDEFK